MTAVTGSDFDGLDLSSGPFNPHPAGVGPTHGDPAGSLVDGRGQEAVPTSDRGSADRLTSLSREARELYRCLMTRGALQAGAIQEVTGYRASEVRAGLEQLGRVGLVAEGEDGYRAVPYRSVVDGLLRSQAGILERVLTHLSERHRTLRTLIAERDALEPNGEVSTVPLVTDPRAGMYDMPSEATTEIATIHPGGHFTDELLERSLSRAEQCLRNGVALRVIHQRAAMQRPRQVAYMREIEQMGGSVRLRDNLPFRLLLIDRSSAVCALDAGGGSLETLLLRGGQFVTMLERVFEVTWVDSVPLSSATGRPAAAPERNEQVLGLSGQQEVVLRMLAEGQTDQAIARRLGVTTRTITRRMGEIYDALGVNNRFQAGVKAHRMGLI